MLTIGQLAERAGVPTSTVRYYERRGLIASESRSEGNYRLFGSASLERLRFIRAAQQAGFTLSDIEDLLELKDSTRAPTQEVQRLIDERLTRVHQQLEDLQHVERELQRWRTAAAGGRCEVIEGLSDEDAASDASSPGDSEKI